MINQFRKTNKNMYIIKIAKNNSNENIIIITKIIVMKKKIQKFWSRYGKNGNPYQTKYLQWLK